MAEPRPSNYQDVQDEKLRAFENKAPTTKTTMGEGKPPSFLGRIKEMVTPSKLPTYGKRTRQQELDEAEKKMKKGGSVKKYAKGGSVKKYETGGSVDTAPTTKTTVGGRKPPSMPPARYPNPKDDVDEYKPPYVDPRVELGLKGMKYLKEKFNLKKTGGSIKSYAKGGSVSSRGDGVAQRGKTKGRFV